MRVEGVASSYLYFSLTGHQLYSHLKEGNGHCQDRREGGQAGLEVRSRGPECAAKFCKKRS